MTNQKKRPITPDDFYLLKNVFDVQLSPDGNRVTYTVSWPDKESDETHMAVFAADIDGHARPRRVTSGKHDHSPRWSPDGRFLAFCSNRGEKNQVYLMPLDGGEARQLTKAKHGVAQPAWSPDSTRIAYTSRTGEYKESKERKGAERAAPRVIRDLRYKLDGIGYFDNRRMHVFTVDVESGEEKQITDGDWHDEQPAWSPDGKLIAFVSDRERDRHQHQWRNDVYVVPSNGGRARKLTRSKGQSQSPVFSPDGRSIAYAGHEQGDYAAGHTHLYIVPTAGGAPRTPRAPPER
jgi:Tol biopolymer transport system component